MYTKLKKKKTYHEINITGNDSYFSKKNFSKTTTTTIKSSVNDWNENCFTSPETKFC